jgi:hypothetical protein
MDGRRHDVLQRFSLAFPLLRPSVPFDVIRFVHSTVVRGIIGTASLSQGTLPWLRLQPRPPIPTLKDNESLNVDEPLGEAYEEVDLS